MKEIGLLNRNLAKVLTEQGHQDLIMVVDAGFAIPLGIETVDISFRENDPMVLNVLQELQKFFSVEKMILAKETKEINPLFYDQVTKVWGENLDIEVIEHSELKRLAKNVKAVIRTGDFTAFGNVILVSGAGERWHSEI